METFNSISEPQEAKLNSWKTSRESLSHGTRRKNSQNRTKNKAQDQVSRMNCLKSHRSWVSREQTSGSMAAASHASQGWAFPGYNSTMLKKQRCGGAHL